MSDEPSEPAGHRRVPLDVFDPSADGVEPCTLGEVVESGRALIGAVDSFLRAIEGCMTPLDLAKVLLDVEEAGSQLAAIVNTTAQARDIIEGDMPLAHRLNDRDKPWYDRAEGMVRGAPLTTKKICDLADRAGEGASETVTYREVVLQSEPVPTIIARDRKDKLKQQSHLQRDESEPEESRVTEDNSPERAKNRARLQGYLAAVADGAQPDYDGPLGFHPDDPGRGGSRSG